MGTGGAVILTYGARKYRELVFQGSAQDDTDVTDLQIVPIAAGAAASAGSNMNAQPKRAAKRTLMFQISSASDLTLRYEEPVSEEGTTTTFDWDDVTNKGKRWLNGQWDFCSDVQPDASSGFMRCFWTNPKAEWLSGTTIMDYLHAQHFSQPNTVMQKPAAARLCRKPAAARSFRKPAGCAVILSKEVRKRECSAVYHRTSREAVASGCTEVEAKERAKEKASKHIAKLTNPSMT